MQTSILRTGTLIVLTVMSIRGASAQTVRSGDRFFNFNVYRANDDPSGMTTVVCKGDGSLYVLQFEGTKVLNFSVDGRHIPSDSLDRYQSVLDEIKVELKRAEEQGRRDRARAELDRQQAGRDREQAERDRAQAERDRREADREREQDQQQAQRDREQADRDRQQAEQDRQQAVRDRAQAERDREQADRDREQSEQDRRRMDSLMRDLVADGIVPDRDSIHSMRLNEYEIIVNGKRLPEALEKKYIARYVKKGSSISYNND